MPRRILVIPEFNEAATIVRVIEGVLPFADMVVIINDGSNDNSVQLIEESLRHSPKLYLIEHVVNKGMSGALLTGFCWVVRMFWQGHLDADDLVITFDADGQHVPEDIDPAVHALETQKLDVLLGRRDFKGYPLAKRVGNRLLSWWASLLGGVRYRDVECGFRVMRLRVVLDVLRFFTGRRYGCAQEIGIISAMRHWHIDNTFPARIAYYRAGARIRDGVTNVVMGARAFWRVRTGSGYDVTLRVGQVLSECREDVHRERMPI